MKFKSRWIYGVAARELCALLDLDERARPHWDFGKNGSLLDTSILDQMLWKPRSTRFRCSDEVGFVWLWTIIDCQPEEPVGGRWIVMKPDKDERLCQYGVASKARGKEYGTVKMPLSVHLRDALESAARSFEIEEG